MAAISFLLVAVPVRADRNDRLLASWLRKTPVIDSINIEGNRYFSDGEVRKHLYSRTRNLWRSLNGDRRSKVQRESLGRDTLEIKFLYVTNGFLSPKIQLSYAKLEPKSTQNTDEDKVEKALILINIEEGNQWFTGSVAAKDKLLPWFVPRVYRIMNKIHVEEPINLVQLAQVASEIKTLYANNGYPYAKIDFQIDTTTGSAKCPILYGIASDSLVHDGDITIDGTEKYSEGVARRELAIKPGDVYSRKDIITSQSRLFSSGYFSSASISEAEISASKYNPDLTVRVRERKTRYVTFRTGAAQSEARDLLWDFSSNFGQRNFLDSRRIDLSALYSFSFGSKSRLTTHQYTFKFTEPWFLGIRMPLVLAVQYNPPLQSLLQDYDIESWKVSASTSRELTRDVIVHGGIEYQSVNITGVPRDQEELKRQEEGLAIRRRLYAGIRRDSRNNLFLPTRGSVTEALADYFGGFLGGDDYFVKLSASWSRYQIVWPGWVSATRLKGGAGTAFGKSTDIPRDERFYLGGANTVRGYKENSLGPLRDDGSPDGAESFILFNQEFRWKTIQLFSFIPVLNTLPLWQSVFVDAGNGFVNKDDISINNIAVTFGTGFQLISPAGPIRVDYGRRVPTDRFGAGDRWHFTILYAF